MPASVDGGRLGRWFEELCRIKHPRLQEIATPKGTRLRPNFLLSGGVVYAFWWTGDEKKLKRSYRELTLKGPGGRDVRLRITDEWLGLGTGLSVPLYVGKSATGLQERTGQHLMLGTKRILPLGRDARKQEPPTTSCQLRAGIEHMFPYAKDTRSIVLQDVGLSYVELDGDKNAANRFYLEDLAIGRMRPPLNVDIER